LTLSFLTAEEVARTPGWPALMQGLVRSRRSVRLLPGAQGPAQELWLAAEQRATFESLYPQSQMQPREAGLSSEPVSPEGALAGIVRGRLGAAGPITAAALGAPLGIGASTLQAALAGLEREGSVLRGRFSEGADEEWCERHLLARIHRYTVKRLRAEIAPV